MSVAVWHTHTPPVSALTVQSQSKSPHVQAWDTAREGSCHEAARACSRAAPKEVNLTSLYLEL